MNAQTVNKSPDKSLRHKRGILIDGLFVSALLLYLVAGIRLVPFHGDEATILSMSRDWFTLIVDHDPGALAYQNTPTTPDDHAQQDLRVLNGVIATYAIGLTESLIGTSPTALNTAWSWGQSWWINGYYGHVPSDQIMFAARLSSVWLTMFSVSLIFVITRRLIRSHIGGRAAAWIATFIYATTPAVLLDGRRALFEGATLLALSLVILAGLTTARQIHDHQANGGRVGKWRAWLLLGLAAGLALATKYTLIVIVVPIFAALLLISLRIAWQIGGRHVIGTLARALFATVTALVVFLALTPIWWQTPLSLPGQVLTERQSLIALQVAEFGGYATHTDRLTALWNFPLGAPQYFEDTRHDWQSILAGSIHDYEAAGLSGIDWMRYPAVIGLLIIGGVIGLARISRPEAGLLFGLMLITSLITTFALNPLPWQRYYLPLSAFFAILCGIGAAGWFRVSQALWRRYRLVRTNAYDRTLTIAD